MYNMLRNFFIRKLQQLLLSSNNLRTKKHIAIIKFPTFLCYAGWGISCASLAINIFNQYANQNKNKFKLCYLNAKLLCKSKVNPES